MDQNQTNCLHNIKCYNFCPCHYHFCTKCNKVLDHFDILSEEFIPACQKCPKCFSFIKLCELT